MDFFIKYNTLANNSFDIRYIDSFICNMEENILYIEIVALDYCSIEVIKINNLRLGMLLDMEITKVTCRHVRDVYLFKFENNSTKLDKIRQA